MAQNIYDNADFFAGYSALRRSVEGLDGAPEWPVLRSMLPEMTGLRVLDVGCGFGWFCGWASEAGAGEVVGIDLSENMLAKARSMSPDKAITYVRADMDSLDLAAGSFDLVYSSLALHYVERLPRLVAMIHAALVPGGRFVFSAEHPLMTASPVPGWIDDTAGRKVWPVTGYLEEGPRTADWITKGVVKQHRTVATYLNMLMDAGFSIARLEEWGPTPEQIADRPALALDHERPAFLLVSAATIPPGSRTSC